MRKLWVETRTQLKILLAADIAARLVSNIVKVYVVLYILNIISASPLQYGLLISMQMVTSILSHFQRLSLQIYTVDGHL